MNLKNKIYDYRLDKYLVENGCTSSDHTCNRSSLVNKIFTATADQKGYIWQPNNHLPKWNDELEAQRYQDEE